MPRNYETENIRNAVLDQITGSSYPVLFSATGDGIYGDHMSLTFFGFALSTSAASVVMISERTFLHVAFGTCLLTCCS